MEEIGALIQNRVTGKSFSECFFKKKSQITLQSLYSSIKIGDEKVITLFLRLVVMVERRPEEETEKCFEYHHHYSNTDACVLPKSQN